MDTLFVPLDEGGIRITRIEYMCTSLRIKQERLYDVDFLGQNIVEVPIRLKRILILVNPWSGSYDEK